MTDYERLLHSLASADVSFVIVGGVAATIHGSARLTSDLDIVYARDADNIDRLVRALAPLHPYLRGVPDNLPFRFDAATIQAGLNFTCTSWSHRGHELRPAFCGQPAPDWRGPAQSASHSPPRHAGLKPVFSGTG